MTSFLRGYWWWLLLLIAIGHQVLQKCFGVSLLFFHAYLDDVLCMPLFLGLWNWERQRLWKLPALRYEDIFALVLVVFIVFELIIPPYDPRFTKDWWDGLAYLTGALIYLLLRES